jgi:hypothetical protein
LQRKTELVYLNPAEVNDLPAEKES